MLFIIEIKAEIMKTDLVEIFQTIRANLQPYTANGFAARINSEDVYEVWADKQIDANGEKRDVVCFSSVTIKEDYVELCLTPITEEPTLQDVVHPDLMQLRSENSCFKITELDDAMVSKIADALTAGFTSYKQKGWV